MTTNKKFSLPDIYIYCPEDLSKQAFIYWRFAGKRKKVYGHINRETTYSARLAAAERLREVYLKKWEPKRRNTQWKKKAFAWVEDQPLRPKSKSTYRSCLNTLIKWLDGRKLNSVTLKEFFIFLSKERHGSTHKKYRQKLKQIMDGVGEHLDWTPIKPIKAKHRPARYFQEHERAMLKVVIERSWPDMLLFIEFMYYCFIRPKELRALKAGNVLLDNNQIYIPAEISKNGQTGYVAIPVAFRPRLEFIKQMAPGEWLFPSPSNPDKPIGVNTMWRRHDDILKKLRFGDDYTLYSWKHTGAVQFIKSGGRVKELQIQLRHHSLDQVNEYLRQMGVWDLGHLCETFPEL